MKVVGREIFTVRSCTSLLDGYSHGRAFEEVEEIWQMMRSEGGVGINQRAVSVYFDACGFSGSLSRAIETWEDLRTTGFNLNDNNYQAYQECLTRCGAWDELFSFFAEQQAQHLVAPTSVPPLSAPGLAAALKLGRRLVQYPRHRSLHPVDWDSYNLLKRRIEDLVSKETWEEERSTLLSSELEEPIFMSSKSQVASTRPERSRQHGPVPTVLFSSRLGYDSIDALGDISSWRETATAVPFFAQPIVSATQSSLH
ncbi:hypothetical protein BDY24DRAFT_443943 [Mrakia frigida]|uniref:pentatricopeptide repeat-containing protein n=1 Tax=Mrakia frigida TaxID=29902 RepID=UPI003FCC156E